MAIFEEFDLDLDPEKLERDMHGETLPEGLYVAQLVGSKAVEAKNSGLTGTELTFEVIAGDQAQREIKETIWDSDNEKAKNRKVLFAHKLGLLQIQQQGEKKRYVPVEGKSEWTDALYTRVVIDVVHDTYDKKDKNGNPTGEKGKKAILRFGGIYDLESQEKKIREFVKNVKIPGESASPSGSGASGQPPKKGRDNNPKKVDLSDV